MDKDAIRTQTTSKGNQSKWHYGNIWIKEDYLGYESLAECICSDLLSILNIPHVQYFPCKIIIDDLRSEVLGCYSYDYRGNNREITLAKILKDIYGKQYSKYFRDKSTEERIEFVLASLEPYIDRQSLAYYLSVLLNFDAFVLNEDRHLNNISFFCDGDKLTPTPIYDNGAALLSDVKSPMGYTLEQPTLKLMRKVKSKPFSTEFKKQTLCLPYSIDLPYSTAVSIINKYRDIYDTDFINRVRDIFKVHCSKQSTYYTSSIGFSAWSKDGITFYSNCKEGMDYYNVYPTFKDYRMLVPDNAGDFEKFVSYHNSGGDHIFDAVHFNGTIIALSGRLLNFIY